MVNSTIKTSATTTNADTDHTQDNDKYSNVEEGHTTNSPTTAKGDAVTSWRHNTCATNLVCPASTAGRWLCALFLILIMVTTISVLFLNSRNQNEAEEASMNQSTKISVAAAPTQLTALQQQQEEIPGTLGEIYQRGILRCGVRQELGRAVRNAETKELEGFSVDLCLAIASAIFGADNARVDFKVVEASNRFQALQSGEVDVLASWDTYTMQRDLFEPTTGAGFTFSVPYFYDGMALSGLPRHVSCAISTNSTQCRKNLSFCTIAGTTYISLLESMFPGVPVSTSIDYKGLYRAFSSGVCNVVAGERFALTESVIRTYGYTGDYMLGKPELSHEPLSLVTRDGDPHWSDFVNWIVEALLTAEEMGYTRIASYYSFQKTDLFGENFRSMFVNALTAAGNYGELYERNLESIIPRADINKMGLSGLIYSYPFGETTTEGPDLVVANATIDQILQRGYLRCGIVTTVIFAIKNVTTNEWSGFDVDFCRALAAALFDGNGTKVEFIETTAAERFLALQNGTVDVLSRITTVTYARDVKETTSQKGLTFARPNFYDGLGFGGIPPFLECAEKLDVLAEGCQNLKICVQSATTFLTLLEDLITHRVLVPIVIPEDIPAGLRTGACNVIAGGANDIARSNIIHFGNYTGPYATGTKRFSKDPLTLVTREDDPQWSSFVFWSVMAVFFAEEQGITQKTSHLMPSTNLFGSRFDRYLKNIVGSVGSYGDIYQRNVESEISRGSTNLLNKYPFGPQHFPLPGLV